MGQTWEQLLFAHWPVAEASLRPHLPPGLELDRYDGDAWLGITPFAITGVRARGAPPFPGISELLELNVRTYVTARGKPGIWFFSLDASRRLAVAAARRAYRLPYFLARMSLRKRGGSLSFSSTRRQAGDRPYVFSGRHRPYGSVFQAQPGSLEAFLAERYCLYASDARGRLFCADIHHAPWLLEQADAEIELNTMPPDGVELPCRPPLLHFARRQDVVIWPLVPVKE